MRISFLLHRGLSRVLAFLDDKYRLNIRVRQLDPGWREGVRLPPNERLWKLGTVKDDRQTYMWARDETDPAMQAHQRAVWMRAITIPTSDINDAVDRSQIAAAKIRARGGEVVFVRPPSAPVLRALEETSVSRAHGWELLITHAAAQSIHYDDYPAMQGLVLPENSHLSRACATVFTDAYVRALARVTPRLALLAQAPRPLGPADCARPAEDGTATHPKFVMLGTLTTERRTRSALPGTFKLV